MRLEALPHPPTEPVAQPGQVAAAAKGVAREEEAAWGKKKLDGGGERFKEMLEVRLW